MQEQLEKLKQFQTTFKSTYNTSPTLIDREQALLRYHLLKEENEEYLEAVENDDLVEILDAQIDCLFLVLGSLVSYGFGEIAEKAFEEVFNSNMSKTQEDGTVLINGINAFDERKPQGKILKSSRYFPPNLKQFISNGDNGN